MKKLTILISEDGLRQLNMQDVFHWAEDVKMETVAGQKPVKHRPEVSTERAIMNHFTAEGMFTSALASKWIAAEGHAPTSSSATISKLIARGHLERLGRSKLRFKRAL